MLTLRYDPTLTNILPKLTWKNFIPKDDPPSIDFIEKSLFSYINEKIPSGTKTISLALSGGIDSTLVLALIRKIFPEIKINAISIKFTESIDETPQAAKIANKFNANHEIVTVENFLLELPKAISIVGLPFWDLHWYYVSKKAKDSSKFLASGDGGDELFGGYTFRYAKYLSLVSNSSNPLEKVKAYLECHERDRVPDQEKLFGKKVNFSWDSIYEILLPYFDNQLSLLDQVLLADYNGKLLYNFSIVNTKINDYFNVQSITPLLTEKLIKYFASTKNEYKYNVTNNLGKIILRNLLEKYDAESLIHDEKLGFSVNTINLWKKYAKRICKDFLLDSRIVNNGWLQGDWIKKNLEKNDLDIKYINKFLGLLAFEIWYRLFITHEMNQNERLE